MRAFVAVAACLAFCSHARRVEVKQPAADAALKKLVGLLADDAPGFNMPAKIATMRSARPGQPEMEEAVKEKEAIPEDEWEKYDFLLKKVSKDHGSAAAWLASLESVQEEAEAEMEKAKAEMSEEEKKEFEEKIAKLEAEDKAREEAREANEEPAEAWMALRRHRTLEGNPFPIDAMDTFEGGSFAYWQIPKELPYPQEALEPAIPLALVRRLAALQTRFTNQLNRLGAKGKLEDYFVVPKGSDDRSTVDLMLSDEDPATIIQLIKDRRATAAAKAKNQENIDESAQSAIWSAAVAVYGFNMFWDSMSPTGGEPTGAIKSKIDEAFGSFDSFKKEWIEAAKPDDAFWVWLEQDIESGSVKIVGGIEPPPQRKAKGLMAMYNGPGMSTVLPRVYDGSRDEENYAEAVEAWLSKANFEFANANLA